ncbi:MAG: ABC transporter substrate-binding protein [Alphaproteobacteria bacterium]
MYYILLLLPLLLASCKEEDKLIVGTSVDNPPFEFYQNEKAVGFDIELIDMIAKELDKKIEIKDLPFEGLIGGLQSKRIDIAIAGLSAMPGRVANVDMTDVYYTTKSVLLTLKDEGVESLNDLTGQAVGVQLGTDHEEIAKSWQNTINDLSVRSLTKIPELIQDLKAKRTKAVVIGNVEAKALIKENKDLRIVLIESNEVGFSIALPKGSELTVKINNLLKKWKEGGALKALEEKWLNLEEEELKKIAEEEQGKENDETQKRAFNRPKEELVGNS